MEKIVILGAGIAGISAAYTADKLDCPAVVYEADKSYGGLLDNFTVKGFRFDKAVHLSFTKNPFVRSIFDQVPFITHQPEPQNFEKGRWLKHPVQNNLYPLPVEEKVEAILSFIQRPELKENVNYHDWLIQQYGKYIAERYPIKYTKKYWTIDPKKMPSNWIGNRLYRPDLDEVLYGAMTNDTPITYYAKEMRYPQKGGYRSFLTPMLSKCNIQTSKQAVRINPFIKFIEFSDGTKEYYSTLVSSVPLPSLISIIDSPPKDIKEAADKLWATSIALVSIGFNRPNVAKHLWFYIYDESILPARVYSTSLKSSDNVPEGCSSLQFEIYFSKYAPLQMKKENLIEHVLNVIEKMKLATKKEIIFADCRIIPFGNVVFDYNTIRSRNIIIDYLKSMNIIPIGRFGEWDYLWSDQSLLSGKRAVEKLLNNK